MSAKTVKIELENGIATVTISRPEALNALNREVIADLGTVTGELSRLEGVRAVILTGSGEKAFVAGADIKEMQSLTPAEGHEMSRRGQAVLRDLQDLPVPVIGAINGFALGGGLELALACDFLIASKSARWGLPEVTLGLIPGYGGTQRLSRALGRGLALRVALSGEIFSAQQGYEWGLFAQLTEPADLLPAARRVAATIASRAPLAVAWVKSAVHGGSDGSLGDGLELESALFEKAFATRDRDEGLQAFLGKRQPHFQGK